MYKLLERDPGQLVNSFESYQTYEIVVANIQMPAESKNINSKVGKQGLI